MNLQQLSNMSDESLNELSAVKVMGWEVYNASETMGKTFYYNGEPTSKENFNYRKGYGEWNPTNDMNDAMEIVIHLRKQGIIINLETHPSEFAVTSTTNGIGVIYDDKPSRAITIASILAKGE